MAQPQPTPISDTGTRAPIWRRHPLGAVVTIIALGTVVTGGYFIWMRDFHPYESTDDAFVEARNYAVSAQVGGYLEDVKVTDNQHVNAGAIIANIDPRDYQIALDQANAAVRTAQAAIENAQAQLAVAQATINEAKQQQIAAKAALEYAQEESSRQDTLARQGVGTAQLTEQALANLRQAQANYNQLSASVVSALKSKMAAKAQVSSASASLQQAQAQSESAKQNLTYTVIKAEQPGRIVQLSGSKGQLVEAGQAIAMFVPDEMWVTANFKETQLTDMRPGQAAQMEIDAYPGKVLHGKVASIQPGSGTAFSLLPAENATGNYVKVTQRVPVKITVDQWPQDVAVGPGMSVVPTVTVRPEN